MPRRLPSLNALRAFEAAARHVSLTLAAQELNVTHAAISRHVRELETWLGVRLFERTGRGVRLTTAGGTLAADLTPTFDQMAEAVGRHAVQRRPQTLSVSAEASLAQLWLLPRLVAFSNANPGIELALDASNDLVDFARQPTIDLGIRYGRGPWPGTSATLLLEADQFPVCCPDLLADGRIRTPADLSEATLLHEDAKHELWRGWLTAAGVAESVAVGGPVLRGPLAISAAENGQGFAIADAITAADGLLAARLVRPFVPVIRRGAYWLVRSSGARPNRLAEAFHHWLERAMSETVMEVAAFAGTG
jgi:LysR family transcriptional regulator, glycine cleavage system transcriptional activator